MWLDALTTNVDRTPRNPNLLVWHGRTWLIDHGAALFRQHGSRPLASTAHEPFPSIADHVLLGAAGPLHEADERLAAAAQAALATAVALVPEEWLGDDPEAPRAISPDFLAERLRAPRAFVDEAEGARAVPSPTEFQYTVLRLVPSVERGERSTSASSSSAASSTSCRRARTSTRSAWRRSRPASTPTRCARRSRRSATWCAATRRRPAGGAACLRALRLGRRALLDDHPALAESTRA